MRPFAAKSTVNRGPEAIIQDRIVSKLKSHDWYVKVMIGNMYQFGVPDLLASHHKWGIRFIEVKNPKNFSFTAAQQREFPLMHAAGIGIWILMDDTEAELNKLFKPANWFEVYFKWSQGAYR